MNNCARCHGLDGSGETGPDIRDATALAIEAAIDSVPLMIATVSDVTSDEVQLIAEFLDTSTGPNQVPVADASTDQNVLNGALVTLDGSASFDSDGDLLTYLWTFASLPGGSGATLSSTSAVSPTFTADMDGSYEVTLVVNDGTVDSAMDSVTVTAATGNAAPVADAGADQSVPTGVPVSLDGTASTDANGDLLTYTWNLASSPGGSTATLSSTVDPQPNFTADLDGDYVVTLVVNDGTVDSIMDSVTVTASTANIAPVADAGPDQSVPTGSVVSLDGTASSDPNGDLLTYAWTFSSKPGTSLAALSDPADARPAFTADVDGDYALSLVVSDGSLSSSPEGVIVTATTGNSPPVANAGVGQSVLTGSLVTLDGSGSSDADGDALTYAWAFSAKPAGSTAALSSTAVAGPTFTTDVDGSYVMTLVVNDGTVDSTEDGITVTAAAGNVAPVANAGADQQVTVGALVTLDGNGSSDGNADGLTYAWAFSSRPIGSTAALSSSTAVGPTFTADVDGNYVVTLVVNDGTVDSGSNSVVVTAIESGATLFSANCQTCHGPNGTGTGTAPNIQGKTKVEIDSAIANVTQMKNKQNLKSLTDSERQAIADFLVP